MYAIGLAAIFISGSFVLLSAQKAAHDPAILKVNKEYDKRTVVRKSTIPNAGNGLFAAVRIKEGEVIGELGGRLVTEDDPARSNHYIASLPECAWEKTRPYKYIDSKDYGAHVSRINFAPSEINGVQTNFQNAAIEQICQHPYFVFVALRDIESGTEILSSYGADYEYGEFMKVPEVRDYFCGLLKIDCREKFTYSY
jgi:SET domain-containing protein